VVSKGSLRLYEGERRDDDDRAMEPVNQCVGNAWESQMLTDCS
jgi:hypothetical protein